MRQAYELYRYFSEKHYSTISGTLVYFLLMSIAPFLLWLTLLLGSVNTENLMSNEIFAAINPIVSYLKSSAETAASGAGIVLLITSLYSSTNFFYHLRRSGEMIYGVNRKKGGIRLRLAALAIIAGTIVCVALIAAIPVFGAQFLSTFMPEVVADIISYTFITLIAVFAAVLLNCFACPYKLGFDGAISGSLLTTALWLIFATGFTIYLRFADPTKLYGRIAAIIIFLLWCYIMINCLVVGIIYNEKNLLIKRSKKLF